MGLLFVVCINFCKRLLTGFTSVRKDGVQTNHVIFRKERRIYRYQTNPTFLTKPASKMFAPAVQMVKMHSNLIGYCSDLGKGLASKRRGFANTMHGMSIVDRAIDREKIKQVAYGCGHKT